MIVYDWNKEFEKIQNNLGNSDPYSGMSLNTLKELKSEYEIKLKELEPELNFMRVLLSIEIEMMQRRIDSYII